MKIIKKIIGTYYEIEAIKFLQSNGYIIIDRNINIGHKEIDILCIDPINGINIIVEVKYRNLPLNDVYNMINLHKKKEHLQSIIDSNILEEKFHLKGKWRIDIIFFGNNGMDHLINID